jgi:simple sugar transport system ATP-binding protein
MVHQHFMLVPVFTVTGNVVLGVEPTVGPTGHLDIDEARREVTEISTQYGLAVDPGAVIEDLPVGVQQRVEIIKVLFREAEVIVFDEPTAVLTPQEVRDFFRIVEKLKDDGKAIIFISHKLTEVMEISDRISVLRRGKVVGTTTPAETTMAQLAEMMVGRAVDLTVDKTPAAPGPTVLEVTDLVVLDDRNQPAVNTVSFTVKRAEIVGIAGVQGNGQTELVEALTGLRPALTGTVKLGDQDVTGASPRDIHRASVAHVPEDRQREGLVLDFDLTENLILDSYYAEPFSRGVIMNWEAARRSATELVEQYDVRTPSIDVAAGNLSGGNQQKLIVAREFSRDVKLIVASQPTRGVDVGSIEYIHQRIVEERDNGSAVLIVSSELDEIMALADRILVMFRGRIVAETTPGETTNTELGLFMAGTVQ